ncbi:hypothetical protein SAY87_027143 [Trapa incisa]|uniref:Protein kinase domain-containing protein n=1 Tax=Trapa incisa TaxID=236973 RepID=A0AAN7JLJ2_9MYRT|nr:hypothetical protein SAY87_027143 [Trapa incisa]
MSSLPPPPPPSSQATSPRFRRSLVTPIAASAVAAFSCLLILIFLFTKLTRRRNATTADSKPPHRYPYSLLRRATNSFSASRRLGQGGFGSVFSGSLPNSDKPIAVKLMDSGSLQGEREFQNELFFAGILSSPLTVPALGFSFNKKRRRMLIVYELMPNGNLQDALLHRKCAELMEWKNRFSVAVDIARGIEYLHSLDPPVIHGDIKPSNILLDRYFSAKIGDFGLARVKSENQCEITVFESELLKPEAGELETVKKPSVPAPASESEITTVDDNGSVLETDSVATTAFEEFNVNGVEQSPENHVKIMISDLSQEPVSASPRTIPVAATSRELSFDKSSLDSGKRNHNKGLMKTLPGKDWWWKQDNSFSESGKVKDYVMEWIGSEIKKERPKSDWLRAGSSSCETPAKAEKNKKHSGKRLDWWVSMDEEKNVKKIKKEKRRPAREWWKEEYCEELARKKKKKKQQAGSSANNETHSEADDWWSRDGELHTENKKKSKSRSRRSSKSSVDWWLDGISGDLWRVRRNSYDSGEVPKSAGISSTPSMRGTVCYIAPEYGGGGDLSEKCDVYSFGVLLLVVVAGRRPLQVTGSPMSEFQRANLISWTRNLARAGKLLDLVDQSIKSIDRDGALLCITVALLCLQKSPIRRPSMKEVVDMLTGASDPPQLPFEFSPSPQSRFHFKSQRKAR